MSGSDRVKRTETLTSAIFCTVAIFGALFLIYILGVLNGRETERREQTPASYSQSAKADAQRACVEGESGATFECIYEKVEASIEQASAKQDLSAQQRAATSALASAVVALLTLVISVVGVWYVKRTLDATLEAVRDTGLATQAMVDANKIADIAAQTAERANQIAKSSAIESRRPWLEISGKLIEGLTVKGDKCFSFIKIAITNHGETPAVFVSRGIIGISGVHTGDTITSIINRFMTVDLSDIGTVSGGKTIFPKQSIDEVAQVNFKTDEVFFHGKTASNEIMLNIMFSVILMARYKLLSDGPDDAIHYTSYVLVGDTQHPVGQMNEAEFHRTGDPSAIMPKDVPLKDIFATRSNFDPGIVT